MDDPTTIGARLLVLRKWRQLTQTELAGLAGLSQPFISQAERGLSALDRRSHIAALANALRVSEADIVGGPHLTSDPDQSAPHAYVPALRLTLETNSFHSDPVLDRARPLAQLADLMSGPVEEHRRAYDYVQVGDHLPALIDELHWHVSQSTDERDLLLALHTILEAYMCAAGMARSLRHPDLGHAAAMRADQAAILLDDPLARGKAAFALVRPNAANWHRARNMAERAVNRLEPHVHNQTDVQVLGMLTLNAALAAATTRNYTAARHWLDESARLAERVPDDLHANWQAFSSTNVRIWKVMVAVESGEAGGAVAEKADLLPDIKITDEEKFDQHPARKACFFADIGRGLARDRKRIPEGLAWLERAESVAPQRIRNDPKVHETVAVMLKRARTAAVGRDLRGMASRMGIPH